MSEPELARPPIAGAPLSVVLIASDTEASLKEAVAAWDAFLATLGREYQILLVTGRAEAVEQPRARVLKPKKPHGIGSALRAGFAAAVHPLVACADPRYRPEELKLFLERIDAVDLVIGCRAGSLPSILRWPGLLVRGAVRVIAGISLEPLPGWSGWKHWFFHRLLRLATGVRLHDVTSGLQLFRREVVAGMPIQAAGPVAWAEIIAKANFLGCLMTEVPIAGPPPEEPLRPILAEGYRVLAHTDFGSPEFLRSSASRG